MTKIREALDGYVAAYVSKQASWDGSNRSCNVNGLEIWVFWQSSRQPVQQLW